MTFNINYCLSHQGVLASNRKPPSLTGLLLGLIAILCSVSELLLIKKDHLSSYGHNAVVNVTLLVFSIKF
jgi:hypothetical protein